MIAVVTPDLIFASRVEEMVRAHDRLRQDRAVARIPAPKDLPNKPMAELLIVDWGSRDAGWATDLRGWLDRVEPIPKVVLFGPHRDLQGMREARAIGLGAVLARSQLVPTLSRLLG